MLITVYRNIGIYFRLGFYSLNLLNKIKGHFFIQTCPREIHYVYC